MSEIKLISPLLDDFDIGGSISEHHGVSCYPAMRKDTDDRYIIKNVSIPASQTQLDALLLTGAYPDAASAVPYFKDLADDTVAELDVLQRLSQGEGFVGYEDWQVAAKTDSVGFDVCMVGTYKYTLRKFMQHQSMTHLSAVNLGLDICSALAACRRTGYVYVDLKPNNIYVNEQTYSIGDIGFQRLDSLKYATLPNKYCSQYTAPEALDAFSVLSPTLDVYALGLILYQAYNGGELPFSGHFAPAEKFEPPMYADYEMAEIILKACSPDPEERWQDPAEMGQALVSYMQRNGANDTPIAPPVVKVEMPEEEAYDEEPEIAAEVVEEDIAEETQLEPEDEPVSSDDALSFDDIDLDSILGEDFSNVAPADDAAEQPYDEDSFGNMHFLADLSSDETMPENNLTDVAYDEVSDELSEILSQADELVAHPVPEAVVAPDAPEINIPEEVSTSDEDEQLSVPLPEPQSAESEEVNDSVTCEESPVVESTVVVPSVTADEEADTQDGLPLEDEDDDHYDTAENGKKKKVIGWILSIVIFLLIASIAALGFYYYRTIYLLPINDITVTGNESSMVVYVETDIDETLLSVVCSDSHGNQISAPVVNGTATFANLTPDTAYNVRILVEGFHRLTGETAASYSTPAQTNIVQFNAVTGAEDGSVILAFTLEGPDTGNWQIVYSAADEEEKTANVLSHMVTLTGLTVGKEYTFTLLPGENMYVTGITEITYTASKLVYAEDVTIVSCVDNQLTTVWTAPKDTEVASWTVRCYNDADYNQTAIVTGTTAVFEGIDPATNYTIEVTAAGMSVSERAFMAANAITITNFGANADDPEKLVLSWDSSSPVPADGWVLTYGIEGSDIQGSVACSENSAEISPFIPGVNYTFKLQQANGAAVLTAPLSCTAPNAQDFSGYGMTRGTMSFRLCKRPDKEDWNWGNLTDADYTSSFNKGEKIALIGQLHESYGSSDDLITTMFVIKDADGNVVNWSTDSRTWNDMWYRSYTELEAPDAPTEPGEYTLTIYFNGKFVTQKPFTIIA